MDTPNLGEMVCRKHEKMKSQRMNWETHWDEVAEYIIPRKDDIYGSNVKGEKKHNKLFTSVSVHANEQLASALHGMLTNPSNVWFGMSSGDKDLDQKKEVKEWLQNVTYKMIQVFNTSNFQTEVHQNYLDLGSIGTTVLRVEEDDEMVVRFMARPIYEAYIDENYKGMVDTVSYEYRKTLRSIRQEFGMEPFDNNPDLKEALMLDPQKEMRVIHLVMPREDFAMHKLDEGNRPYMSVHVLKEKQLVLKTSGFFENPYIVPRWTKISGEIYGRSPGMKALSDIKMVNALQKTVIIGAQKVVDPPLQAPDDGVLLPLKTAPGKINYYRAGSKDRIEPLMTGSRPDIGENLIETIVDRIKQAFFIDQLQIRMADRMTATEVMQRREEQLRMLGPILGRQNFEFLKPLIDRVFGIMSRKKMFPDAPPELQDMNLEVKYTSQIARVQETSDADSVTRVFGLISPLASAKPEMLDNFDADKIARHLAHKFGLPAEYLTSESDVQKKRQAMAKQMQQEAQGEQLNGELDALGKLTNL